MEVFLNRIDGVDDAICALYMSKRTLTPEQEYATRYSFRHGVNHNDGSLTEACSVSFGDTLEKLFKYGRKHITLLRFIDLSFTVYGLHRGAQDDFDSHAMRLNNRILRSSTRLADFGECELSDYYQDKIIPTDSALAYLGIDTPDEITVDGKKYVKAVNGYVLKGQETNRDVKRGLYMLSIPSNFIFRCNLTEWAHIYKLRRAGAGANPELSEMIERAQDQVEAAILGYANRELLMEIQN